MACLLIPTHINIYSHLRICSLISEKELINLEKKVWDALVSGDIQADSALLADDFLGVYTTGFEGKEDHAAQLITGPTILNYQLSNVTFKVLCANTVLLSYQADYTRRNPEVENMLELMYVSSVWQNRKGKWVNVFSQDTVGICNET